MRYGVWDMVDWVRLSIYFIKRSRLVHDTSEVTNDSFPSI